MTENWDAPLVRPPADTVEMMPGLGTPPGSDRDVWAGPGMGAHVAEEGAHAPAPEGGTVEVVKEEAGDLAQEARDEAVRVAGVAADEVAEIAAEVGRQAKDVYVQTRQELAAQMADQQARVADGLRKLGAELVSMAKSAQEPGVAADLANQAGARVDSVGSWLEHREPGAVLGEVKTFARRRPGAFLALAAGAGLLAGRLTRGLSAPEEEPAGHDAGRAAPVAPAGVPETVHRTSAYEPRPVGMDIP